MNRSTNEIVNAFGMIDLHDFELTRFSFHSERGTSAYEVRFEVLTPLQFGQSDDAPGSISIGFIGARIVTMEVDLLGLLECSRTIGYAKCTFQSELKEQITRERNAEFGTRRDPDSIDDYLHFQFNLVPPGGVINIFAMDFVIDR